MSRCKKTLHLNSFQWLIIYSVKLSSARESKLELQSSGFLGPAFVVSKIFFEIKTVRL